MSSLKRCINKFKKKLPEQYFTDIEKRAEEYRAEGVNGREANRSAVEDALKDATEEKQDYEKQVKKLKPELFKVT